MKDQIIAKIKEYETIIIHRHVRPDPDAIGSQVGLKKIIQASFPDKNVYAVGEEDPSLHFLAKMDDIDDTLFENALIIVCDTANQGRISDKRYELGEYVIKIDHHPNNDTYGDIKWIDTTASSTCELIYSFAKYHQSLKITDEAARLIYAGIVGDTGRFLFPNTTNQTFHYAAELVSYDFDRTALYNSMYDVTEKIARMRGFILQNFKISKSGATSIKITKEILDEFGISSAETGGLVGTLGDIQGVKAWIIFIEEEYIIRARIRSKGPVINTLANKYNGGGHPLASGASVKSWEEADELAKDLDIICQSYTK